MNRPHIFLPSWPRIKSACHMKNPVTALRCHCQRFPIRERNGSAFQLQIFSTAVGVSHHRTDLMPL
jgi:hypothetical protein